MCYKIKNEFIMNKLIACIVKLVMNNLNFEVFGRVQGIIYTILIFTRSFL